VVSNGSDQTRLAKSLKSEALRAGSWGANRRFSGRDWPALCQGRFRDNFYARTEFEFDSRKSRASLEKHGVDFVESKKLWDDPDLLEVPSRTEDEPRWSSSALTLAAGVFQRPVISCVRTRDDAPFTVHLRHVLAAIATQAGVALENAGLVETSRAAERLKDEFVATVSHELRTPVKSASRYRRRRLARRRVTGPSQRRLQSGSCGVAG